MLKLKTNNTHPPKKNLPKKPRTCYEMGELDVIYAVRLILIFIE